MTLRYFPLQQSSQIHWILEHQRALLLQYLCYSGYSLILRDEEAGRNHTLKEQRTAFEGWKTDFNLSQVNRP